MSEQAEEIVCPYCNGMGGNWQYIIVRERYGGRMHESERGVFVECRGCHGLREILADPSH